MGWIRSSLLGYIDARCERFVAGRKAKLLGSLSGNVLELGPGTGVNFRHFRPCIRWSGIEPNDSLHAQLIEAASARGIEVISLAGADDLAFVEDASVDAVVSMFALCTVPAPERTLRDVLRVLKPDGRLVFMEHVGAQPGTWLRRAQQTLEPLWARFADGCRLTQETAEILGRAGFSRLERERFTIPVPLLSPHVAGTAFK